MPSADQVPVKSAHSTMLWPMWVVLIAGLTGSALRAVRPPNRHITPDGRVAEGARLESVYTGNRIVGSNPTPSASPPIRPCSQRFATSRVSEQEMGLSTLFMAFGFLEWTESNDSEKKHYAPLSLLPASIARKRGGRGKTTYSISAAEENADSNLGLQKKLERDFGFSLPRPNNNSEEDCRLFTSMWPSAAGRLSQAKRRRC